MAFETMIARRPDVLWPVAVRAGLPERAPMGSLQRFVGSMLDDFERAVAANMPWAESERDLSSFYPRLDVVETASGYELSAEIPGVSEKDLDICLSDSTLMIRGEKKSSHEEQEAGWYRRERTYGRFMRSIALPSEVDREHIAAHVHQGVLHIEIPKSAEAQKPARHIAVKVD